MWFRASHPLLVSCHFVTDEWTTLRPQYTHTQPLAVTDGVRCQPMTISDLVMEAEVGLVVPPLLTGLWLIFVYINNRIVERRARGSRIEPHPLQNLIHRYLVILFLMAIHYFRL